MMLVGVSAIDVTPKTTVDLSGFAARTQPMTGVLDPIRVKAIYLEQDGQKLLWLGFDLLALSHAFVSTIRKWARRELNIEHVLLSATHTHSAPAIVQLTACGKPDEGYIRQLGTRTQDAVRMALSQVRPMEMVFAQNEFPLAVDRRGKPSAHVDSVISAIGWKRQGAFEAIAVNYPMHPVTLGHVNRKISADWCGVADTVISNALSGSPIVLISNGACGNINPPERPVAPVEMGALGRKVAEAIISPLRSATPIPGRLRIAVEHLDLPLETMTADEIDQMAAARMHECAGTDWAKPFGEAMTAWRDTQKSLIAAGKAQSIDIELFAVDLGPVVILAVSGELFSRFAAMLRERISKPLFVVGYANAVFGYIPTREAYAEGGYEVDQAHFFYNSFRPRAGGLEMLADRAVGLLENLGTQQ